MSSPVSDAPTTTSATGTRTGTAGASTGQTAAGGTLNTDCTALTPTEISAALGGTPAAGPTQPAGGCEWSITNSTFQTAPDDGVALYIRPEQTWPNETVWAKGMTGDQAVALPDIAGHKAYFQPGPTAVEMWDGTQSVVVHITMPTEPTDAASQAKLKAAATTLADDLAHA